jgi:hypothetical protein
VYQLHRIAEQSAAPKYPAGQEPVAETANSRNAWTSVALESAQIEGGVVSTICDYI